MREIILIIALLTIGACKSHQTTHFAEKESGHNYSKPLSDGQSALEIVPNSNWPDLGKAWERRDLFLCDSIDNSIEWFKAPSSKQWFPMEGISHEQAQKSVLAIRELLTTSKTKNEFLYKLEMNFDVYRSVGCDDHGTVLFTGYYSPDFYASTTPSRRYNSPLYSRPPDLAADPASGEPLGRKMSNGSLAQWPTRSEIVSSNLFNGNELVWVEDYLDAYTIHVNGSARLRLDNGELMYIGYAGKTDRPYTGLGSSVLEAGLLPQSKLSLRNIRQLFDRNPKQISKLIDKNESFVFFREYNGSSWPSGSLGVPVTARRSIATDKKIFPRGGIVLVDTTVRSLTGETEKFTQFMVDQDTGGAIRAPGRADLFMGVGPTAGIKAGSQYAEGNLYYIFLKPESIASVKN
ncbi:MAG: MltA domain-containing protein [Phycisphaerales bacterium]|nr:MltA domain-containing protein [Phycisphaerales bacterium]MDP6693164.1 MltA domain-containing protein [Phycisphaerales bacterium]